MEKTLETPNDSKRATTPLMKEVQILLKHLQCPTNEFSIDVSQLSSKECNDQGIYISKTISQTGRSKELGETELEDASTVKIASVTSESNRAPEKAAATNVNKPRPASVKQKRKLESHVTNGAIIPTFTSVRYDSTKDLIDLTRDYSRVKPKGKLLENLLTRPRTLPGILKRASKPKLKALTLQPPREVADEQPPQDPPRFNIDYNAQSSEERHVLQFVTSAFLPVGDVSYGIVNNQHLLLREVVQTPGDPDISNGSGIVLNPNLETIAPPEMPSSPVPQAVTNEVDFHLDGDTIELVDNAKETPPPVIVVPGAKMTSINFGINPVARPRVDTFNQYMAKEFGPRIVEGSVSSVSFPGGPRPFKRRLIAVPAKLAPSDAKGGEALFQNLIQHDKSRPKVSTTTVRWNSQKLLEHASKKARKTVSVSTPTPTPTPHHSVSVVRNNVDKDASNPLAQKRENLALRYHHRTVKENHTLRVARRVTLPLRQVHLFDVGCQTDVMSLVEPGRMIEISIEERQEAEQQANLDKGLAKAIEKTVGKRGGVNCIEVRHNYDPSCEDPEVPKITCFSSLSNKCGTTYHRIPAGGKGRQVASLGRMFHNVDGAVQTPDGRLVLGGEATESITPERQHHAVETSEGRLDLGGETTAERRHHAVETPDGRLLHAVQMADGRIVVSEGGVQHTRETHRYPHDMNTPEGQLQAMDTPEVSEETPMDSMDTPEGQLRAMDTPEMPEDSGRVDQDPPVESESLDPDKTTPLDPEDGSQSPPFLGFESGPMDYESSYLTERLTTPTTATDLEANLWPSSTRPLINVNNLVTTGAANATENMNTIEVRPEADATLPPGNSKTNANANTALDHRIANANATNATPDNWNANYRNVNAMTNATNNNVNAMPRNVNLQNLDISTKLQAYHDWVNCIKRDPRTGNLPIHLAVLDNDNLALERQCFLLTARKMSLDVKNFSRKTALHFAVSSGRIRAATILRSFGARMNETDARGNNSIHLAVQCESVNSLMALLTPVRRDSHEPVPVNSYNDNGYTPLHVCCLYDKTKHAKLLLENKAEHDLKDLHSGRTPLFLTVELDRPELMELLLSVGAKPLTPNFAGQTALALLSDAPYRNPAVRKIFENCVYEAMNAEARRLRAISCSNDTTMSQTGNVRLMLEATGARNAPPDVETAARTVPRPLAPIKTSTVSDVTRTTSLIPFSVKIKTLAKGSPPLTPRFDTIVSDSNSPGFITISRPPAPVSAKRTAPVSCLRKAAPNKPCAPLAGMSFLRKDDPKPPSPPRNTRSNPDTKYIMVTKEGSTPKTYQLKRKPP